MFVKNPNLGADPKLGEITVANSYIDYMKEISNFFVGTRYQLFNKGNLYKINIQ